MTDVYEVADDSGHSSFWSTREKAEAEIARLSEQYAMKPDQFALYEHPVE